MTDIHCDLESGACPACGQAGQIGLHRNCPAKHSGRVAPPAGPATRLHKLLVLIGIARLVNLVRSAADLPSCGCAERARRIDAQWFRVRYWFRTRRKSG